MKRADLHIHSIHSPDGELTTLEILTVCKKEHLEVIAVTDHNTTNAVEEAILNSDAAEIKVISGIEIDCNYKGTDLHVLGYHINHRSHDFSTLHESIVRMTMDSFDHMIANLAHVGIEVNAEEVLRKAGSQLPSPELIAEVLLTNPIYSGIRKMDIYRPGGVRSDMPFINFYLDFFAQGKPAYVKFEYMSFQDAISLIRDNGGIPVIAHPGLNFKGKEGIVHELLEKGAGGFEVFNNYHSGDQTSFFCNIAVERKVLATCGSDFHGKNKPLITPGIYRRVDQFQLYVDACVDKLITWQIA